MNKKHFLIIAFIFVIIFIPLKAGNELPTDLDHMAKGGKIISPAGTYRSGGIKPSTVFYNFLSRLGDLLKKNDQLVIDIRGHSDDQGTAVINKRVSFGRAELVKNFLIKRSGIAEDRIIARGYSDNMPLTNNETENGRMRNRRVELVMTDNRNPVGEITFIRNNVFTKSPEAFDFKRAEILESLFNLYKLNTKSRSGANIKLSDESKLNIGPDSLMVIYEMVEKGLAEAEPWKYKKVKLLTGFLRTKLDNLRKGLNIETPQCSINSRAKVMLIDISKKKRSSISVFDGDSDINALNKTIKVEAGFGTFVKEGKTPADPEPLPKAPGLVSPLKNTKFSNENPEDKDVSITFKWESGEELDHIQISKDEDFTKIVLDEKVSGNTFAASLDNGDYFWRVAGINKNGIEGYTSVSDFIVRIKMAGLPLEISPEAKDTPLDAHGATIVVTKRSITITGKTIPGAKISISRESVNVDQDGKFSKEIFLVNGWNIIKVNAIHPDYRSRDKWISVCYFRKWKK